MRVPRLPGLVGLGAVLVAGPLRTTAAQSCNAPVPNGTEQQLWDSVIDPDGS